MSQERHDGKWLAEPITLDRGRVLLITKGEKKGSVHIHIGKLGTTFPESWVKYLGDGNFSDGLVKTSQGFASTLKEIGII